MSVSSTVPPRLAAANAVARPMPLAAPVIRQSLPLTVRGGFGAIDSVLLGVRGVRVGELARQRLGEVGGSADGRVGEVGGDVAGLVVVVERLVSVDRDEAGGR